MSLEIKPISCLEFERPKEKNEPPMPIPKNPFCMYVFGSCGKGKTTLIDNLVFNHYLRYFDTIIYCCPNLRDSNIYKMAFWHKKRKKIILFNMFDDEVMDEIEEIIEEEPKKKTLLILDDCCNNPALNRPRGRFSEFIIKFRHSGEKGSSVILTSQLFKGVPISFREVCNKWAIFQSGSKNQVESLYETLGYDMDKKSFVEMVKKIPMYNFMFYDQQNNKTYANFTECLNQV